MPSQTNAKITVSNFGPVKEGEFELKPLTIFIGPNNSGKSYMAILVYALAKVLVPRLQNLFFMINRYTEEQDSELLNKWLLEAINTRTGKIGDMPQNLQQTLQIYLRNHGSNLQDEIKVALREYFGYEDVTELQPAENNNDALFVSLVGNRLSKPFLTIRVNSENKDCFVELEQPDSSLLDAALAAQQEERASDPTPLPDDFQLIGLDDDIIKEAWSEFLIRNGLSYKNAYYLPSARSGILQGWQLYASLALKMARQGVRFDQAELPRLLGIADDFLQILWGRLSTSPRRPRGDDKMKPALELLEDQVFRGQVTFARTRSEQPSMLYKSGPVEVPLQRASSMIAELAPLDLWLKYLLEPGDLLIIDEPEAHLHPENQRMIARVLVRLVRAGVQVICPTHSSLILHQVSNQILASQLPDAVRRERFPDFTEDDLISIDEVGVYLFDMRDDGTHIEPVPIDPEFGISEEEFVRVAEAIGEETYKLSSAMMDGGGDLG